MKKFLLGAAAALAIAAPGVASAQSGYIGGLAASQDIDNGGAPPTTNDSVEAYGVDGAVFFDVGAFGVELDGLVLDNDDTDTTTSVQAHLFSRNENHLLGAYVQYTDNDIDSAWGVGLEANKFFDKWTLNGAVGYGEGDDSDAELWGADVGVSMFATENLRIDASIGYVNAGSDAPGVSDAMSYGIGGELGFGSLPISIGVNWSHYEPNQSNSDIDTIAASLRFNFGSESLFDRDRNGASQAGRTALGSLVQTN